MYNFTCLLGLVAILLTSVAAVDNPGELVSAEKSKLFSILLIKLIVWVIFNCNIFLYSDYALYCFTALHRLW